MLATHLLHPIAFRSGVATLQLKLFIDSTRHICDWDRIGLYLNFSDMYLSAGAQF